MQVEEGGQYAIRLRLINAEHLGAGWIPGAMLLRYPGAMITKIEGHDGQMAVISFGWRGPPGLVQVGDRISPAMEGLMTPQEALPLGEVETAMVLSMPVSSDHQAFNTGRLLLAGALLGGTWLMVRRIKV
jgi:hypothetical protein